jgi:mono/diheme cytochrome c family protein
MSGEKFTVRIFRALFISFTVVLLVTCLMAQQDVKTLPPPAGKPVDFDKDIQPIFLTSCIVCHGSNAQRSNLRLDSRLAVLKGGLSGPAIVPGKSAESLLVRLIAGLEPDRLMPLGGPPLSDEQIGLIRAWVDQGAPWPEKTIDEPSLETKHWAYRKPIRPQLPAVRQTSWPKNAIDYFVLARLEKEGLEPSPEADRTTLIRRVSLDLTGLPPSPEAVDAFLADKSPHAYENLVNRLLASPHYGERWARIWLDLARYADSHGYESDPFRVMWRYRDWVINALNCNMPFDQFTIEQIAGDMLPDATLDQKVASGFHRNTMWNMEGGVDPEQTRVETIVDRVNTTASVWLGTTLACTQCHNHKYDPFSQKEYYQFFAFFNNADEPEIEAPAAEQLRQRQKYQSEIAGLEAILNASTPELETAQARWEHEVDAKPVLWTDLDPVGFLSAGGATLTKLEDKSILVSGVNPENDTYTIVAHSDLKGVTGIRLEALTHTALPGGGPGRDPKGSFALSQLAAHLSPKKTPQNTQAISFKAAFGENSNKGQTLQSLLENKADSQWSVDPGEAIASPSRSAFFENEETVGFDGGMTLTFTLSHRSKRRDANLGRFRLWVTASPSPVSLPDSIRKLLSVTPERRTASQKVELAAYYRSICPELQGVRNRIAELHKTEPKFPTAMVMQERGEPRATHIHIRGNFLNQGEQVTPGVPAVLSPLPQGQPANRLTLARWLVDESNPLVARVTVNRFWEQYFGRGLVATSEDFGTQGERPTHPELLDWLATEFVRQAWDNKAIHRLIVTSATYRQSSNVPSELASRDPANKLLARGPRFRLEAEMVRDVALAASGLLSPKLGGPSVFPPQPEGIWTQNYSEEKWVTDVGDDRYRRGLYTFWRRTAPYPSFLAFDAPTREFCAVRRPRTNTPLQALTTMNDPAFVEAAQALARRIVGQAGLDNRERMTYGFRLCVSRPPKQREEEALLALFEKELVKFSRDVDAAVELAPPALGRRPAGTVVPELAAWTVVANVLLNLDETVTKE